MGARFARAAPATPTVLYDGACPFCRTQVARLRRWARDDRLAWASFREPGVLLQFPGLSEGDCDRALQFVREDGRAFAGTEGIVRVLARRALLALVWLYYLPGLRQAADALYRWVAAHRMRLPGGAACSEELCGLHGGQD